MNDRPFSRWLWAPIVASVILMVVIGVFTLITSSRLDDATAWRQHSVQVILCANALQAKLHDAEVNANGYLQKRRPELITAYQTNAKAGWQELNRLLELTRDNPAQQAQLQQLAAAVQALLTFNTHALGAASVRTADSGDSLDLANRALGELQKFAGVEKDLLIRRDAAEQKAYHGAAHLLVGARMLVAVLLILANVVLWREITRRRRSEAGQRELISKLQTALAEVKTLSGLIPICGWCRNVRSDSGYWQTVEQYVGANTNASFTHGVCPHCAEKFNHDLLHTDCSAEKLPPTIENLDQPASTPSPAGVL